MRVIRAFKKANWHKNHFKSEGGYSKDRPGHTRWVQMGFGICDLIQAIVCLGTLGRYSTDITFAYCFEALLTDKEDIDEDD